MKAINRLACSFLLMSAVSLSAAETYTATGEVKNAKGTVKTAPITVTIERFLTAEERDTVVNALKAGGSAGLRKALQGMKDIGSVEVEGRKTALKYAFTRPTGDGKIVAVAAPEPIAYVGGKLPGAKPKEGYDLSMILLVLDGEGKGTGEAAPAAKAKIREDGAIVTEDYGADTVWLKGVTRK